ncbi:MAG: diguanylate cyclase, partial [Gammaproteobacteria bacterium]|nr:diguanylate cyclase [Gammaproteobacteria bacterium]
MKEIRRGALWDVQGRDLWGGKSLRPLTNFKVLNTGPSTDLALPVAGMLVIGLLLALTSANSYLLFHTLVELFSIGVAFAILLLAWNTREVQDLGILRIIALGFGAAAIIDLLHTLAYKGMTIFPGDDANLPTQLWIAARYLQALTLLAAPWLARRLVPLVGLVAAYGTLTLLLILAVFSGYFPDCYVEGQGLTPFKITSEYLIVAIILAGVVGLHRVRAALHPTAYRFLQAMALVTIAQELAFTAYIGVYDLANMAGHLLKLVAYYLLYRAIFVTAIRDPFLTLFRDLKATEQSLLASQAEIQRQHADLERRVVERTAALEAEIRERHHAEQALTESAANFRAFFETVGDLIVVAAPDGRILFANPACQRTLGYDETELSSLGVLDLHPADCRVEAADIFAAMFRGERQACPLPLASKDGLPIPVETRIWPGRWNGADCIYGLSKDLRAEQEAQQRFERLFHSNPAPMALTRLPERRLADVNQAFLDTLGYTRAEVIGQTSAELGLFEDPTYQQTVADQLQTQGRFRDIELQVRRKDGVRRDGLFSGEVIRSQGQEYFLTVMADITQRKQAEQRLQESEQRLRELSAQLELKVEARTQALRAANEALRESEEGFRTLFEETRQPLALMEGDRFIAANRATLEMLRAVTPEQLIGHTAGDFSTPVLADGSPATARMAEHIRLALEHGAHEFEWESLRVGGEPFPSRVLLTAIRRGNRQQLHVVWNDITEQKQAQARVEYLAYYDALTGLPNRVLGLDCLAQKLAQAQRHQRQLAVLYLDLDHFKHINDSYGHLLGDKLLQGVAWRLTGRLRAEDSLCRLAADEFLLVLPEVGKEHGLANLASLCDRLINHFAQAFELDGHQVYVSLSLGVALYPRDGADGETLMRHADTALYEAKRAGCQTYRFFEPCMNDELMRFIQIRDALREALERHEFVLHYQPQVDLQSGRLVGVEALLRWQRPGMGLLAPGHFLDVAEESGLIVPISRWVLHEACRQAA